MKKKLIILVCFLMAIGTYATVTGIQNSLFIQNVLADSGGEGEEEDGGDGDIPQPCGRGYKSEGIGLLCRVCEVVEYDLHEWDNC